MLMTFERYHVPAHVQEHIDYITPGIKLFTTGGKVLTGEKIEKRGLGRGRSYKHPPILEPLPRPVAQVMADVAAGSLDICSAVISPDCVKGIDFATKFMKGHLS